jgi:hypothetical protein
LNNISKREDETQADIRSEKTRLQLFDRSLLGILSGDKDAFREVFGCPPCAQQHDEDGTDKQQEARIVEQDIGRLVKNADRQYVTLPQNGTLFLMPALPTAKDQTSAIAPTDNRKHALTVMRDVKRRNSLKRNSLTPTGKRKSLTEDLNAQKTRELTAFEAERLRKLSTRKRVKLRRDSAVYRSNPYVLFQMNLLSKYVKKPRNLEDEEWHSDEEDEDQEVEINNALYLLKPLPSWLELEQEVMPHKYVHERKKHGSDFVKRVGVPMKDYEQVENSGLYLSETEIDNMHKMVNDVEYLKYLVVKLSTQLNKTLDEIESDKE